MQVVPPPVSDAAWEDPYPKPPPARGRWLGWLAAFLVLGLVGLVVQDRLLWPREPVHQGRPLSAWMQELTSPSPAVHLPARTAVRAMGTNALPALERHLRARDSWLGRWVTAAQGRLPHRLWVFAMRVTRARNALERRWQAAVALNTLGPLAAPALPALTRALEDPEPRVVSNAAEALRQIGPQARPALVRALSSTNDPTFHAASYALRRAGAVSSNEAAQLVHVFLEAPAQRREQLLPLLADLGEAAVPLLGGWLGVADSPRSEIAAQTLRAMIAREFSALRGVTALTKHSDARVRAGAARVLGSQALWARTSINALSESLLDPEPQVRAAAAEALREAADWTPLVTNALPVLRQLAPKVSQAERPVLERAIQALESRAAASSP